MMPENVFDFSIALDGCHAQKAMTGCEVQWKVPADLPYLEGHFPQMPIVPGVALIDASVVLLQQFLQKPGLRLKSVKQAKFMSPLTIDDQVAIQVREGRDGTWEIEWKNAAGDFVVRLNFLMI